MPVTPGENTLLRKLLSQEQDTILKEERRQLEGLQVTLARLDAPPRDMLPLQQALRQLEELFLPPPRSRCCATATRPARPGKGTS